MGSGAAREGRDVTTVVGEPQGSPTSPLLPRASARIDAGLPAGEASLRPRRCARPARTISNGGPAASGLHRARAVRRYVRADEDRRLRQAGPGRRRPQAARPVDEPARPVRRGVAQPDGRERRRGGAAPQGGARRRGRRRLARPREGDGVAAQGPRDGRRPRRARLRPGRGRLRSRRDELRARQGARARGGGPRPLRPAVERRGRSGALGCRLRPAAAAHGLAGRRADPRRRRPSPASGRPSSATT